MRKLPAILTFLLLLCSLSLAQTFPGPETRKPGNLAVIVTASDSMRYIKESVGIAQKSAVVVDALHKIRPGDLTYFAFLVSGLTPDKKDEMRFSVGYRLLDPAGKVLFTVPNYAQGKTPSTKEVLLLADPALEVVMEDSDPKGKYRIEAKVTDPVSKKTATGFYEITLVK